VKLSEASPEAETFQEFVWCVYDGTGKYVYFLLNPDLSKYDWVCQSAVDNAVVGYGPTNKSLFITLYDN